MTGLYLGDDEVFNRQGGENSDSQARRILTDLKNKLEEDTELKIGLIYAANNVQALSFSNIQYAPSNPDILNGGTGQAELFKELIILLKKEDEFKWMSDRVKILPIATSLRGGENSIGNAVDKNIIYRDINFIKHCLQNNHDVYGFPRSSKLADSDKEFSIGGGASKYWLNTNCTIVVMPDGKIISQNDFVQGLLRKLQRDIYTDIEKEFKGVWMGNISEATHYTHATLDNSNSRFHFFKSDTTQYTSLNGELNNLKGDALKTKILLDFKIIIEEVKSGDGLDTAVDEFKKSDKYKILSTGQGIFTRLFGIDTSSVKALEDMVEERREKINAGSDSVYY